MRDARGRFGSVVASVAGLSVGDPVFAGSVVRPVRGRGFSGLPVGMTAVAADAPGPWERRLFAVPGAVRRVSGPLGPVGS